MAFFKEKEETTETVVSSIKAPDNWIKAEHPDIFNPVHKIVRHWSTGVTVTDMINEIERADKTTKSRKKEEVYYAILASLYRMIYVERGEGAYIKSDDLDQRKKAIFIFVFQIVRDIDIKNTTLSNLVLRMVMDFIEVYKSIIEEYDARVCKNQPNEKIFTKLMNVLEQKYAKLLERSSIENKIQQEANIIHSTS